tara:strand:+ start:119 stop:310 length:192 start_codon:yes stop_codon:yes gene_type:complete
VDQIISKTVELVDKETRMQLVGGQKVMLVVEAVHADSKVVKVREAVMLATHTDIHGLGVAVAV